VREPTDDERREKAIGRVWWLAMSGLYSGWQAVEERLAAGRAASMKFACWSG
jgi:hypothetical protein